MKEIFLYILFGVNLFYFTACTSSKSLTTDQSAISNIQQVTKNNTTLFVINNQSSQRQTILKIDSTGNIKVLGGQSPEPDFLKNIELDSNVKVNGKTDLQTLLKSQAELVRLNNKSASLAITREALYRLSEAYFNGLIDSTKYAEMYQKVIAQSADLVSEEIELEEAKAEIIVAETEKAKIELQKAQLEFERYKFEKGIAEEKKPEEKETLEEKVKGEKE